MDRTSKTCLVTALLVLPVAAFAAGPPSNAGGHGHGGPGNTQGGPGNGGAHGNPGGGGQDPGADHRPGPPQGNGNGNGYGGGEGGADAGDGPGRGRGRGGPGQSGGPGGPHGGSGGQGPGDVEDDGDHGPGDLAGGPGRGNSQGALHANYHATQAICRHQAAAAHSAIGVNCGGIIVATDPRTGASVYSQTGMDVPQSSVPSPTTRRMRKSR